MRYYLFMKGTQNSSTVENTITELAQELSDLDPKVRAAVALDLARAKRELALTEEVIQKSNQPWWSGRHIDIIIGVAIAGSATFAFFLQNLSPLIGADEKLALKRAEIAAQDSIIMDRQLKLQRLDADAANRENLRVINQLRIAQKELQQQGVEAKEAQAEAVKLFQAQVKDLESQLTSERGVGEAEKLQLEEKFKQAEADLERSKIALLAVDERLERLSELSSTSEPIDALRIEDRLLQIQVRGRLPDGTRLWNTNDLLFVASAKGVRSIDLIRETEFEVETGNRVAAASIDLMQVDPGEVVVLTNSFSNLPGPSVLLVVNSVGKPAYVITKQRIFGIDKLFGQFQLRLVSGSKLSRSEQELVENLLEVWNDGSGRK